MAQESKADRLRRKLEDIRSLDFSGMGYESKSEHEKRLQQLEQAYQAELTGSAADTKAPTSAGTSP